MKSGGWGEVHSVYKNTINVNIGNKIIAIHPSSTIKTPMSIRIEEKNFEFECLDISIGEVVIILEDKFVIGEHEFFFNSAKTWDPNIEYLDIEGLELDIILYILKIMDLYGSENSLKEIVQYIINPNSTEILNEETDYFTKKAFYIIMEYVKSIIDKASLDSLSTIVNLVGLGKGLTPSGDDFLVGLCSVFILAGARSKSILEFSRDLKKSIIINLDKTTFLSKEFLYYATKGEYSEIFHEFYMSIKRGSKDEIRDSVVSFMQIGSSSGMDTLAGILLGMYMVNVINKDLDLKGVSYD